jgi:hypothetical protein
MISVTSVYSARCGNTLMPRESLDSSTVLLSSTVPERLKDLSQAFRWAMHAGRLTCCCS